MELIKISPWRGIFILLVALEMVHGTDKNFEFNFEYAVFVDKADNRTDYTALKTDAEVHICQLKNEEILEICKKATGDPLLKTTKVDFVEGPPLGEKNVYEFTLTSYQYRGKPPIVETACSCPTNPRLYLRDRSFGNAIEAYVSIRESVNSPS